MNGSANSHDRREELLAEKALGGLTPSETAELGEFGDGEDRLELAAAALDFGLWNDTTLEPLPTDLRARLLLSYPTGNRSIIPITQTDFAYRVLAWSGWVASAASIIVIMLLLNRNPVREIQSGEVVKKTQQDINSLMENSPSVSLTASDHPLAKGALGELVWNGESQNGWLKISGLAPVDPKSGVYQLWIFDKNRDLRYPIEGGMFGVQAGKGETTVPISPKLNVGEPTLFVVTLEPPGGVVVSDRQRIMLTAAWDQSE